VTLKRAGTEYKACCPFHDEKTPSFTVSQTKQFYHCFGCGAHGTAIGFLMDYDGLSFPDAIEDLAGSIGLTVPREGFTDNGPDKSPVYEILEQAAQHFSQALRSHPKAQPAVDYLRNRGLSGEIASRFRIGYAPPGWDNLLRALDSRQQLRDAGLISEPEDKCYDRFRNRIMFPILDSRGRVVGFGGRVIDDNDSPKYLNSPETSVFHKGSELYGLYEARKHNRQLKSLLVVEGYMDVVALSQFEVNNAVATLGTATTDDHLEKLFRAAPEVTFCFDGDRAGREAAWKALVTTLPQLRDGRQARFMFLPDGEDPDSLVRIIGTDKFIQTMDEAQSVSDFLFGHLAEQVDMRTLDGRARLVNVAKPYLETLPGGVFRSMMEQRLGELSGSRHLGIQQVEKRPPSRRQGLSQPGTMRPIHRAIALLLQHPQLAQLPDLPDTWQQATDKGSQILVELLETLCENPHLTTASMVEHWQEPEIRKHLGNLAAVDLQLFDDQEDQFRGTLENLSRLVRKTAFTDIRNTLRPSDLTEEDKANLRALYNISSKK
jgi:DNA primase